MRKRNILLSFMIIPCLLIFSGCAQHMESNADRSGNIKEYRQEELTNGIFVKKGEKFYSVMPVEREQDEEANPMEKGTVNEKRFIWFVDSKDHLVPIIEWKQGDKLILRDERFDRQPLILERMEEQGYTLGVKFKENQDGFWSFDTTAVCSETHSMNVLKTAENASSLCVHAIGENAVGANLFYANGVLKVLEKDSEQTLRMYEGTIYRERKIKADTHLFFSGGIMELSSFVYTENGYVEITLPEKLKAGYYEIAGYGLFYLDK